MRLCYNYAMKTTLFLAAALAAASAGASGASALKPAMWADVPDVAPLRVGDTYYMVSTTMHFNPGVPVMASKDLVNRKTISYCYRTVEDRPQDRLENGAGDYGLGTWASSIRYDEKDGFFYVTSFNNKVNSTYLFCTKDPTKSEWEFFRLSPKQYDESLWIEDGRFYVFATGPGRPYKVRLTEMKPDFSGFVDDGRIILDNVTDCAGGGGLGEGTQVFKRNGWYYIVNIGWPKNSCHCVIVHRSRNIDGPWEGRIVFEREGIAQGSFIDRPDGSWVAVLFNRAVRERQKVALPDGATKVWLKAVCDFTPCEDLDYTGIPASTDKGKFYYSFDGKEWTPFDDAFDLVYTIPHFIGYRFGLCCFSTSEEGVGGFADFDYLRIAPRDDAPFTSDGSNPIVKTRFTPDPAAVVDGEWLYVFSGHDELDARGYTMRDWGVVRTKDLKNWVSWGPNGFRTT